MPPRPCSGYCSSGGPLGVPAVGRDEHVVAVGRTDVHGEQLVALAETHADDAGGRPAHRPQRLVGGGEADRLRLLADQQQVVLGGDQRGARYLVVLAQVDGDEAAGARRVVLGERASSSPGRCLVASTRYGATS